MPKISYSLAIAIIVHLLILVPYAFLVDKDPEHLFAGTKNVINLNFGSGSSSKASSIKKTDRSSSLSSASSDVKVGEQATEGTESATGNGSGIGSGTQGFEGSVLNYQGPTYPRLAVKRGLEGTTKIRIKVSTAGLPEGTEILKSSGHEILDQAALASAQGWRFQIKESPYFVEKSIVFKLLDKSH